MNDSDLKFWQVLREMENSNSLTLADFECTLTDSELHIWSPITEAVTAAIFAGSGDNISFRKKLSRTERIIKELDDRAAEFQTMGNDMRLQAFIRYLASTGNTKLLEEEIE